MHQLMYNQSRKERKILKNLLLSLNRLQVKKFACLELLDFLLLKKIFGYFEILANCSITHDSSIFPAYRAHGGFQKLQKRYTIYY